MGSANVWLDVSLAGVPATTEFTERFFSVFDERLLHPKSVQVMLPGRGKGLRFKGSIDGDKLQAGALVPTLPDEIVIPGTMYVKLPRDVGLPFSREREAILAEITRFHAEAKQLHSSGIAPHTSVSVEFWGLTRVHYLNESGAVDCDWVFCEILKRYGEREPIMEMRYHIPGDPAQGPSFSILIASHAWSCFTSEFDDDTNQWKPKANTFPAKLNAQLLADVVRAIAQINPGGTIFWELAAHRLPDLSGSLSDELCTRIGPPQTKIPVVDMP